MLIIGFNTIVQAQYRTSTTTMRDSKGKSVTFHTTSYTHHNSNIGVYYRVPTPKNEIVISEGPKDLETYKVISPTYAKKREIMNKGAELHKKLTFIINQRKRGLE